VVVKSQPAEYDLLPANSNLTAAEAELVSEIGREYRLRNALKKVKGQYDFILIDCPPSLNMLTVNALVAADSVLIPVQCEYFALEGLADLLGTIEEVRDTVNTDLGIEGVIRTMYDPRNSLTTDVSHELLEFFGSKVFAAVIPRNVRLAEAPSYGLPALHYDRKSRGAQAYLTLALELLGRQQPEDASAVA
jgi:chromosome partitioning protein